MSNMSSAQHGVVSWTTLFCWIARWSRFTSQFWGSSTVLTCYNPIWSNLIQSNLSIHTYICIVYIFHLVARYGWASNPFQCEEIHHGQWCTGEPPIARASFPLYCINYCIHCIYIYYIIIHIYIYNYIYLIIYIYLKKICIHLNICIYLNICILNAYAFRCMVPAGGWQPPRPRPWYPPIPPLAGGLAIYYHPCAILTRWPHATYTLSTWYLHALFRVHCLYAPTTHTIYLQPITAHTVFL